MKIFKNLMGNNDKIHVDEIALSKDKLLGSTVIVDSGENTNGYYIKYGDGTMECWKVLEGETVGENTSVSRQWIFPTSFAGIPAVNPVGFFDTGTVTINVHVRSVVSNFTRIGIRHDYHAPLAIAIIVRAIGRWK